MIKPFSMRYNDPFFTSQSVYNAIREHQERELTSLESMEGLPNTYAWEPYGELVQRDQCPRKFSCKEPTPTLSALLEEVKKDG